MKVGVEPYLGYSQFRFEDQTNSGSKFGTVLGGKGGVYPSDNVWLALDYHLGGPYYLEANKNEYLNRMWGAGLGLSEKGKIRLWAGYYFDAELDIIEHNTKLKGTGFKVSGGFGVYQKLVINLEFTQQSFNRITTSGFSQSSSQKVTVIYMSVSAPLFLN